MIRCGLNDSLPGTGLFGPFFFRTLPGIDTLHEIRLP